MDSNAIEPVGVGVALTDAEERFIASWVLYSNPLKAARAADPTLKNHNSSMSYDYALNMRKRPQVVAEIGVRTRANAMPSEEVIMRLGHIAKVTIEDFIDIAADGSYTVNLAKAKMFHQLGHIKLIEQTRFGTKIILHDKLKALEILGKHYALWVNTIKQEQWREVAIRDIKSGRLTYDDLMEAFKDALLVRELFEHADIPLPAHAAPMRLDSENIK